MSPTPRPSLRVCRSSRQTRTSWPPASTRSCRWPTHGSTGAWSRYGFCCSASPLARSCASGSQSWRLRDGAGHEYVPLRERLAVAVTVERPCASQFRNLFLRIEELLLRLFLVAWLIGMSGSAVPEKPDSHYERKISLVCLSPRKVPPPASEPGHARQVLPLQ